jgi:alkylation response protein AidB-like acyl-CoA dehydrogenase
MAGLRDLQLTDDQLAIVETAQSLADEHLAPHAVEWDQTKHFPVDVLRKAAQLGMGGITIGEAFGGSGLTRLDSILIFEALASGCPTIAAYISIHNMVTGMIDKFGTDAQRARYLPAMCSMDTLGSYCLTEPMAGSDAAALQTTAVKVDDGY